MGYSGTEMDALALRWDSMDKPIREELWERMSIRERKLLKRKLTQIDERKLHAGESFVTKRELAGYFGVYTETKLMSIAANLDEVTAVVEFLSLPFYRRWWLSARTIASRAASALIMWLEARGVRFVQLKGRKAQEADDGEDGGEDGGVHDHVRARRGSAEAPGEADRELRGQAEGDRVPEGGGEPDGSAGSDVERRASSS